MVSEKQKLDSEKHVEQAPDQTQKKSKPKAAMGSGLSRIDSKEQSADKTTMTHQPKAGLPPLSGKFCAPLYSHKNE